MIPLVAGDQYIEMKGPVPEDTHALSVFLLNSDWEVVWWEEQLLADPRCKPQNLDMDLRSDGTAILLWEHLKDENLRYTDQEDLPTNTCSTWGIFGRSLDYTREQVNGIFSLEPNSTCTSFDYSVRAIESDYSVAWVKPTEDDSRLMLGRIGLNGSLWAEEEIATLGPPSVENRVGLATWGEGREGYILAAVIENPKHPGDTIIDAWIKLPGAGQKEAPPQRIRVSETSSPSFQVAVKPFLVGEKDIGIVWGPHHDRGKTRISIASLQIDDEQVSMLGQHTVKTKQSDSLYLWGEPSVAVIPGSIVAVAWCCTHGQSCNGHFLGQDPPHTGYLRTYDIDELW